MNIGLPKIDITFKGLGSSAVERGKSGVAVLVIRDDTDKTFNYKTYLSIADLTATEIAKYTAENVQLIKDVLENIPSKVIVYRVDLEGVIADAFDEIKAIIPMNSWIAVASDKAEDQTALATWVKAVVTNDKKRYKALVYKNVADDMHIVNFTNEKVTFNDARGTKTGDDALAYILGYLAAVPLTMSAIAKPLTKLKLVVEPDDLEAAVNAGELTLFNDEGEVYIARGVNSLTTIGDGQNDEMKFIHVVEVMDLIYSDIFSTWKNGYRGVYPNELDNQMLLISAINTYLNSLEGMLDGNFANRVYIDVKAQRAANVTKYSQEIVNKWDDNEVMQKTVSTFVFLESNIKILGTAEDMHLGIFM